jgi:hypothetical protein
MRQKFALGLIAATVILSNGSFAFAQAESTTTTAAPADGAAKADEKTSEKVDKKADNKADKKAEKKADKKVEAKKTDDSKADEKKAEDKKVDDKKADTKDSKSKKASSGGGDGIGAIPAHIASFAVGTMVGIPVSIFRKSKNETVSATKDLVGDTDNKFLLGAAGILGVPAGVLSGTMQGFFYGPMNAWKGTADEPFSEESFSLGDSK